MIVVAVLVTSMFGGGVAVAITGGVLYVLDRGNRTSLPVAITSISGRGVL